MEWLAKTSDMKRPKFIDDIALRVLAALALLIMLSFTGLYYWTNALVDGVGGGCKVSAYDCLYFSAVTITSLGTNDLRPESFGRVLQVVEVMLGLMLFGLLVAKLSSARTGYLLGRLYSGDAQRRLADFDQSVSRLTSEFLDLTRNLSGPDASQINAEMLAIWLDEVTNVSNAIRKYVGFESSHGTFLKDVAPRAVGRLLKHIEICVLLFAARWPKAVMQQPSRLNAVYFQKRIRKTMRDFAALCGQVAPEIESPATRRSCARIIGIAERLVEQAGANQASQATSEPAPGADSSAHEG